MSAASGVHGSVSAALEGPGVLAASAGSDFDLWRDLLEVVLWGAGAGIGLTIIFSLALRGLVLGGAARRSGQTGTAAANLVLGVVCAVLCVAAVAGGLATMLHR